MGTDIISGPGGDQGVSRIVELPWCGLVRLTTLCMRELEIDFVTFH